MPFKFSTCTHPYVWERLLDRVLRLSDNVTRVETGVTLSNDLISGLDNTSPKAALDIVRDIQRCHDCQIPPDVDGVEQRARPWYADADVLVRRRVHSVIQFVGYSFTSVFYIRFILLYSPDALRVFTLRGSHT